MSTPMAGRHILVAGVLTESSIAFRAAELAQELGAEVTLTSFGRRRPITEQVARRLPRTPLILDFDAENPDAAATLTNDLKSAGQRLTGVIHCVSSSHPEVVGDGFMSAGWDRVAHSFEVSAYSYKALAEAARPLLEPGSGVVGCTVDARFAWPLYGWAGVAKAAYESVNRYLALWLGRDQIRANLVASGPYRSATMLSLPGADEVEREWVSKAPLPWDATDAASIARTMLALTTEWFSGTTGEVIHCDGGYHAVGV